MIATGRLKDSVCWFDDDIHVGADVPAGVEGQQITWKINSNCQVIVTSIDSVREGEFQVP